MDYLCPLPWLHLSVHYDGSLRVCCNGGEGREVLDSTGQPIYLKDIKDSTFLNSPTLQSIRKQMMNGVTPNMCKGCDSIDRNGGESPGKVYSKQFNDEISELVSKTDSKGHLKDPIGPSYVDFTFGNTCNLECRMCAPEFSTSLLKEWKELQFNYDVEGEKKARQNWRETPELKLILDKVTSESSLLLLQVGEPLINPQVIKQLSFLVENKYSKNISLKITTNLTTLSKEVMDLLVQFKGVAIHPSLEGWGEVNDYIRFPSSFGEIQKNLEQLISLKKIMPIYINILTVFQSMNVSHIKEFLEQLKQYAGSLPVIPTFSYLNWPEHLQAHHIPTEIKSSIITDLESYLEENNDFYEKQGETTISNLKTLKSCLKLMSQTSEPKQFDEFINFMDKLDESRVIRNQKINVRDLLPFINQQEGGE
ncbi:MAG: twitch domain-containing radical SAM protein [Bacteriovoracaceae bacterium]|nr:twitch domain-containing radical SAM protein [Bacteriovoracaceae bacterium]